MCVSIIDLTADWLPSPNVSWPEWNACAHIFSLSVPSRRTASQPATVDVYIDEGHPKDIILCAAWGSRSLYYCTASFPVEASSSPPKKTYNSINALNLVYAPHRRLPPPPLPDFLGCNIL